MMVDAVQIHRRSGAKRRHARAAREGGTRGRYARVATSWNRSLSRKCYSSPGHTTADVEVAGVSASGAKLPGGVVEG